MRLVIALVALPALLVGCGGSDEPESKPTPAPSATRAEIGLDEACPRLKVVLETDKLAEEWEWRQARWDLEEIADEGDAAVDALVGKVSPAIEKNLEFAAAGQPNGEGFDALDALSGAGEAIDNACP